MAKFSSSVRFRLPRQIDKQNLEMCQKDSYDSYKAIFKD